MSSNGEESKLQKNECHVLKHLVANARASDSSMAEKMGISTQAVGKIRRKLEEQRVILGYNVQLNPHYIGLEIFSYVLLSVPSELLTDAAFSTFTGERSVPQHLCQGCFMEMLISCASSPSPTLKRTNLLAQLLEEASRRQNHASTRSDLASDLEGEPE
jgi:DNA-binding Lrp family transcriptional regulator